MDKLGDIVRTRREILGLSKLALAKEAGATPNILGNFENGVGTLRPEMLEIVLKRLGIDLTGYKKRCDLANFCALRLKENGVTIEQVLAMDKHKLAETSKLDEINYFLDLTDEDLKHIEQITDAGLFSLECTFLFFKSLVLYLYNASASPNSTKAKQASIETFESIFKFGQGQEKQSSEFSKAADKILKKLDEEKREDKSRSKKPKQTGADDLFSKHAVGISLLAMVLLIALAHGSKVRTKELKPIPED